MTKLWPFGDLWIMIQIVLAVVFMIWNMVCESFNHGVLDTLRFGPRSQS